MIDRELTEFLQSGIGIHLGTRSERLEPAGARVAAVKVEDDGRHLLAFVPKAATPLVFANLRDNGRAALSFARPADDRAVQVKGLMLFSWDATPDDEAFARAQWAAFLGQLDAIGLPGTATANWKMFPSMAVRIKVQAVFEQTPGPDAGAKLR